MTSAHTAFVSSHELKGAHTTMTAHTVSYTEIPSGRFAFMLTGTPGHIPALSPVLPLLALPAPFTPCATDTGMNHGPHPYVVFASGYGEIHGTYETLSDAHRAIHAYLSDRIRDTTTDTDYLPRVCVRHYSGDITTYPRNPLVQWTHALAPSGYRHERMVCDRAIENTLRKLAYPENGDASNETARNLVIAIRDTITSESVGNMLMPEWDKQQLSYLPASRLFNPAFSYDQQTGRVSGKPVRILKQLFPSVSGPDAEWERINTALVAMMTGTGTFRVLTGTAIKDAYCEDNYAPGITWHSCMRYSYCRPYLRIYAENPETVSLLTLQDDDGLILSRALVWQTDAGPYLDRVYANNDRDAKRMRDYARDTLNCQNTPGDVQLSVWQFSNYPYMDTFHYLFPDSGILTPHEPESGYARYYELTSTGGGYTERGIERSYAVTFTRTVTETVTVYVTAENADLATDDGWDSLTDDRYMDIERGYVSSWDHSETWED